jgi:hypothetical protein
MKTIVLLCCAAFLAGCASGHDPVATHVLQPKAPYTIELPFRLAATESDPAFEQAVVGSSEPEVLQILGRPSERLTPDLWIYWKYYSPERARDSGGRDTVVVAFAHGKVIGMKLVTTADLQARLERRRAPGDAPRRL